MTVTVSPAGGPRPQPGTASPRVLLARLRSIAIRYRLVRLSLALIVAFAAALVVNNAHADAKANRDAWGTSQPVWVATGLIPSGTPLSDENLEIAILPLAALPDDAVTELPIGQRTRVDLGTGEIIRHARLAPDAGSAISARLAPGQAGVSLPVEVNIYEIGDRVSLYDALEATALATSAEVIAKEDRQITVGVPEYTVPDAVRSLSTAGVVVVLDP